MRRDRVSTIYCVDRVRPLLRMDIPQVLISIAARGQVARIMFVGSGPFQGLWLSLNGGVPEH